MAAAKKKEKELTQSDPEFLPVQYSMTEAVIKQLRKDYNPALIPDTEQKGDEGYVIVHSKVMSTTRTRTSIEAKRKELNIDALAWCKLVNSEAKRLTKIVVEIEKPWKDVKTDLDEKEAREAEEARRRELEAMQIIEGKVEQLKGATNDLVGKDVGALKNRLALITSVVIDDSYGEYVEAAQFHKDTAITTLDSAIAEREIFEEQQAQVKRDQEAVAAAQKEVDDKAAELDRIRQENEQAAADKMAEQQKKMDEQQALLDKQKTDQEKTEAAEKQRKEDEVLAELEESQRKEKEKADAEAKKERDAELYKRLPEDIKMRKYADELLTIEAPTVESKEMDQLNVDTALALGHLAADIYSRTQG